MMYRIILRFRGGFNVALQWLVGFCHIHWWAVHHRCGANYYLTCRCGKRDWMSGRGYSPLDREWLRGESNNEGQGHGARAKPS
jgi:hypothetical protein